MPAFLALLGQWFGPAALSRALTSLPFILVALGGGLYYGYNKGFTKAQLEGVSKLEALRNEMQQQVIDAQTNNIEIVERVVIEYVDRVEEVVRTEYVYRDVIREVLVPSQCSISEGWIEIHNQAAQGLQWSIDPEQANNPSGVKDTEVLDIVIQNYSLCQQTQDQLTALQQWVNENDISINGEQGE